MAKKGKQKGNAPESIKRNIKAPSKREDKNVNVDTANQNDFKSRRDTSSAKKPIRGLRNLGNTCFFNAVLQNLVRLRLFVDKVDEVASPNYQWQLSARRKGEEGLKLTLPKPSSMLCSLQKFLDDATKGSSDIINPAPLFGEISKKSTQFRYLRQEDSHELLRQLLDGVRQEEIKRQRRAILRHFGIDKINKEDIDDQTKSEIRFYGGFCSHTIVEKVFGGVLVSSVLCDECQTSSLVYEPFLDISLPLREEHGSNVTKVDGEDASVLDDGREKYFKAPKANKPEDSRPSKYQSKKIKQQMRREKKRNKHGTNKVLENDSNLPENDNSVGISVLADSEDDPKVETLSDGDSKEIVRDNFEALHDIELNEHNDDDDDEDNNVEESENVASDQSVDVQESNESSEDDEEAEFDSDNSKLTDTTDVPEAKIFPTDDVLTLVGSDNLENHKNANGQLGYFDGNSFHGDEDFHERSNEESAVVEVGDSGSITAKKELIRSVESADVLCESLRVELRLCESLRVHSESRDNLSQAALENGCFVSEGKTIIGDDIINDVLEKSVFPNDGLSDIRAAFAKELDKCIFRTVPEKDQGTASNDDDVTALFDKIVNLKECSNGIGRAASDTNENDEERAESLIFDESAEVDPETVDNSETAAKSENGLEALSGNILYADEEVQCLKSETSTAKSEAHEWIRKPLHWHTHPPSALSIDSCLENFTKPERLCGNNKFRCENCSSKKSGKGPVYTNASKQLLVLSPPAVLTLHLKRFQQIGMNLRKNNAFVDFPLKLDLGPYCSSACTILPHVSEGQVQYALRGVVQHSGRMNSGHYVAYVHVAKHSPRQDFVCSLPLFKISRLLAKGQPAERPTNDQKTDVSLEEGRWFYVSDTQVMEVKQAQVLKCQAYLLFYERIQ